MASEKDLELLDQYVSNRLTDQDKAAFEKKLSSDSSLNSEFKIQQKVVEKIREARVKELKTMFDNIPASSLETGSSTLTKAALWVAVAGAIGAGVYLYLNSEDGITTQSPNQQEQAANETPPSAQQPQQEDKTNQEPPVVGEENKPSNTDEAETAASPPEDNEDERVTLQSPNELKTEEEPKAPVPIDVFDPTEETEITNGSNRNGENRVSESSPLTKSSIIVETNSNNKKYNFHYQFRNGKLYLYGTFEKNLYEIMEFFSDNKRTVFLFYKDNYYLLSEENDTIKPLAPINDPSLIKKLKDYRGAR